MATRPVAMPSHRGVGDVSRHAGASREYRSAGQYRDAPRTGCRARRGRDHVRGDVNDDRGAQQLLGPARGAPGPYHSREVQLSRPANGQPGVSASPASGGAEAASTQTGREWRARPAAAFGGHRPGARSPPSGRPSGTRRCSITARTTEASGTDAAAARAFAASPLRISAPPLRDSRTLGRSPARRRSGRWRRRSGRR